MPHSLPRMRHHEIVKPFGLGKYAYSNRKITNLIRDTQLLRP